MVIGPAVAVGDGFTPVTNLTLSGADEAEVILHDNGTVVDISGYTWAAITTADGYYHLTLQSGISGTVGHMTVVVNDDSLILPLRADFTVVEEAVYDMYYAASATGSNAAITTIASDLVIVQSDLLQVYSDTTIVVSDTTAIHAQTTTIASDLVIVASDLLQVYSDTTIIYSDTTHIDSDLVVVGTQATTIASDLVIIASDLLQVYSDTTIVVSDTTAIHTQTATVASDLVIVASDLLQVYSDTTIVVSDTTAMHAQTTTIASDLVIVASDLLQVYSDTTVIAAGVASQNSLLVEFIVDTATNSHTPTTTEFQTDSITEATADHFNGRIVVFRTGALAGQATDITDYANVGGIGQLTVTTMTEAPANNDTGVIV